MKQLTNDIYRTKKKLELLEAEGIGQLLMDFSKIVFKDTWDKARGFSRYI